MNISEIQKKYDQNWEFNKTTIFDLYKLADGIVSDIDNNVLEQAIEQGLLHIKFYKNIGYPINLTVSVILSNGYKPHEFTIEKSWKHPLVNSLLYSPISKRFKINFDASNPMTPIWFNEFKKTFQENQDSIELFDYGCEIELSKLL